MATQIDGQDVGGLAEVQQCLGPLVDLHGDGEGRWNKEDSGNVVSARENGAKDQDWASAKKHLRPSSHFHRKIR